LAQGLIVPRRSDVRRAGHATGQSGTPLKHDGKTEGFVGGMA